MIVMPSNSGRWNVHYWQGKYGGLGHLYSPGGARGPFEHLPYALDNGAYAAFKNNMPFDEQAFEAHVVWAAEKDIKPLWLAVPDVVGDRKATIDEWCNRAPALRERFGWNLALCVQDGMQVEEVASVQPDVIFVGGSTAWKWSTVADWCAAFPRVHVGRCNSPRRLYECLELGVESVDGTGWFRGDQTQYNGLHDFIKHQSRPTGTKVQSQKHLPFVAG